MSNKQFHKEKRILLSFFQPVEILEVIIYAWRKGYSLTLFSLGMSVDVRKLTKKIFFLDRYARDSVEIRNDCLGHQSGVWYEINAHAISLTQEFFKVQKLSGHPVVQKYKRFFNNDKIEGFLKRTICLRILAILKQLYLVQSAGLSDQKLICSSDPLYGYVVSWFNREKGASLEIEKFNCFVFLFCLPVYYFKTFLDIFRRGIVFNQERKKYLLSRESVWGFDRKTLRDDFLIDGKCFKADDIIFYACNLSNSGFQTAYIEAQRCGFATVEMAKIPLNINRNIARIFYFYFLLPLVFFVRFIWRMEFYWIFDFLKFQRNCFFFEMFANSFDIGANISSSDYDDITPTVIFNQYGTKNILVHWSDITAYPFATHAFIGHNIYFLWGGIHGETQTKHSYVDELINVGCLFKRELKDSLYRRDKIVAAIPKLDKLKKTVLFFDTTCGDSCDYTQRHFVEYYDVIRKFCKTHPEVNVVLKPKCNEYKFINSFFGEQAYYKEICSELERIENFIRVDARDNLGDVFAIADICVSMSMNTPSLIGLICGKEGLYFEGINNRGHPFCRKYMKQLVFDEAEALFVQIENILEGRFSCFSLISEDEMREFDAFEDDKALERIRSHLCGILRIEDVNVTGDRITTEKKLLRS